MVREEDRGWLERWRERGGERWLQNTLHPTHSVFNTSIQTLLGFSFFLFRSLVSLLSWAERNSRSVMRNSHFRFISFNCNGF